MVVRGDEEGEEEEQEQGEGEKKVQVPIISQPRLFHPHSNLS